MISALLLIWILKCLPFTNVCRSAITVCFFLVLLICGIRFAVRGVKAKKVASILLAICFFLGACKLIPYFDYRVKEVTPILMEEVPLSGSNQTYYAFSWFGTEFRGKLDLNWPVDAVEQEVYDFSDKDMPPLDSFDFKHNTYLFSYSSEVESISYSIWCSQDVRPWPFAPVFYYAYLERGTGEVGTVYVYRVPLQSFDVAN